MMKRFFNVFRSGFLIFHFGLPIMFAQTFHFLAFPHASVVGAYPPTNGTQHYFYSFTDGNMYVYDIDNKFNLVYSTGQPTSTGIRGMVANPTDGMLYIAYGGAGGVLGMADYSSITY